jgi:hypothetical protein
MTSRRKTKKKITKLKAELLVMHTHCKVRHYSRGAKRYKKYLRQITPWLAWKQYAKERLNDWQHEISSDRIRCCFDVPELRYSRERAISGTGYGWLNSEGKQLHASCLGIIPARVYGSSTPLLLADNGLSKSSSVISSDAKSELDRMHRNLQKMIEHDQLCLKSYLHNPIQLSPSDAEAIRKQLYWQLKHYKNEEKRKK